MPVCPATPVSRPSTPEHSERPGFLLRKAHQVAVAVFADEVGGLGLTPPQHNALLAIAAQPGLTQSALGAIVGYDRATVGALMSGMEAKKLIQRRHSVEDKRVWTLHLSARGERLLRAVADNMERINERIVAPLKPGERKVFIRLLSRIAFPP